MKDKKFRVREGDMRKETDFGVMRRLAEHHKPRKKNNAVDTLILA